MNEIPEPRAAARAAVLAAADGLGDLTAYEIERAYPDDDARARLDSAARTLTSIMTGDSAIDDLQRVIADLIEAVRIVDTTRHLGVAFAELAGKAVAALATERDVPVSAVLDSLDT